MHNPQTLHKRVNPSDNKRYQMIHKQIAQLHQHRSGHPLLKHSAKGVIDKMVSEHGLVVVMKNGEHVMVYSRKRQPNIEGHQVAEVEDVFGIEPEHQVRWAARLDGPSTTMPARVSIYGEHAYDRQNSRRDLGDLVKDVPKPEREVPKSWDDLPDVGDTGEKRWSKAGEYDNDMDNWVNARAKAFSNPDNPKADTLVPAPPAKKMQAQSSSAQFVKGRPKNVRKDAKISFV